jgi:diaminopimelate decarboxylase
VDGFQYRNGVLHCDDMSLTELAAEYGTPSYVYSRKTFRDHLAAFVRAFDQLEPLICYAVKTCGNIHILRDLGQAGAGADVVSGGELYRALVAGIPPERVVFAGVGKSETELREAIEAGIACINVESESELKLLDRLTTDLGRTVHAAIRVNPDVAGHKTPEKTTTGVRGSKFGVDIERVAALFDRSVDFKHVELTGLHIHLGSPIYSPEPYVGALRKIVALIERLRARGHRIAMINMGGGFAAQYETDVAPSLDDYAAAIVPILKPFVDDGGRVVMEPGRAIAANAGVLLTQVRYIKSAGTFCVAVVDAGMSTLIRAMLYDAFQFIWPVEPVGGLVPPRRAERLEMLGLRRYDIAGPICESTDYLARERELPELVEGSLLCVFGAGAYGMAMASQYNSTPRPPEVLVDQDETRLIRRRETYADLIDAEAFVTSPAEPAASTGA